MTNVHIHLQSDKLKFTHKYMIRSIEKEKDKWKGINDNCQAQQLQAI